MVKEMEHRFLAKINLYLLLFVATIFITTLVVIGYSSSNNAYKKADKLASLKAQKIAASVKNYLDLAMITTKEASIIIETIRKEGHIDRDDVLLILKVILENNKNYYATWTMWEPNAFDNLDSIYACRYSQSYGYFSASYYRDGNTIKPQNFTNDTLPSYVSSDYLHEYEDNYYQLAKTTKQNQLIPPYYYSFDFIQKDSLLLTSVVAPIIENNEFIGVFGIDINLSTLQEIISNSKLYETGFAAIISDHKKIVAHKNSSNIDKLLSTICGNTTDSIFNSVNRGNDFRYTVKDTSIKKKVIRYFTPLKLNAISAQWLIMVEIPLQDIKAEFYPIIMQVVIIGLISLMILAISMRLIIRSVTLPVVNSISQIFHVSHGHLDNIPTTVKAKNINPLNNAINHLTNKLKLMQQASEMGYWELDAKTYQMEWSDEMFLLAGFSPQQFTPDLDSLQNLIHEEELSAFWNFFNNKQPQVHTHQFKLKTASGQTNNISIKYINTYNNKGLVISKLGVIQDITLSIQKENKLLESETKFKSIFDTSSDAILLIDMDGNFIDANKIAYERSGISREKLLSSNYRDFIINNHPKDDETYYQLLFEGKSGQFQTAYNNANGEKVFVEINGCKMKHKGKDTLLLISRDITERKNYHNEIIQAIVQTEEKERGRLAKELHDGVSPILSTIKLYSNAIIDSEDQHFKEKLTTRLSLAIEEAIKSIYEISNNLTPHILQNFGLTSAVKTFLERIEESSNLTIEFESNLNKRLPEIIETSCYRVIIELLNNTIKHANASNVKISIWQDSDLIINYSDDGVGFDTNLALAKKTSMGLFNISNRLKSLGAEIKIKSKAAEGMNFSTKLKLHDDE
jgi:PAS domain S-box-containing protein